MKSQHTPGPWFVSLGEVVKTGTLICSPCDGNNQNKQLLPIAERTANAYLIAAAPDMLDALMQIVANAGIYHPDTIIEIAKDALNKARG